jgi:hypothetical protein
VCSSALSTAGHKGEALGHKGEALGHKGEALGHKGEALGHKGEALVRPLLESSNVRKCAQSQYKVCSSTQPLLEGLRSYEPKHKN